VRNIRVDEKTLYFFTKCWYPLTNLYGVTTHNNIVSAIKVHCNRYLKARIFLFDILLLQLLVGTYQSSHKQRFMIINVKHLNL
jgi:hypothetical protein